MTSRPGQHGPRSRSTFASAAVTLVTALWVLATTVAASEPEAGPSHAATSDPLVLVNAHVLTMDPAAPRAEAILVDGGTIVAVGTTADVRTTADAGAFAVDLGGRTVVPGFIDSHSHRLTQRDRWGYGPVIDAATRALSEGWTSVQELAVSPADLESLIAAEARGDLPIRVDAFLTVNGFDGSPLDDWWAAYTPGHVIGPSLRIAGLKVFIDVDSGRTLLFEPEALAELLRRLHAGGWLVAMKAIGAQSHELALSAIEEVLGDSAGPALSFRLEHSLAVDDAQLARMARLGVLAAVQPGFPGVVWYADDIRRFVDEEGLEDAFRWPEYLAAGVPVAASPYNPDPSEPELFEPSHVSPMGLLYRAVTQVGLGDRPPEPWMRSRALSVEQLLPLMTIEGARAAGVDGSRGSIQAGKLADLVILSADPLVVPADELPSVDVDAVIVDGVVAYVRPGAADLAGLARRTTGGPVEPSADGGFTNVAAEARVRASSSYPGAPAENVIDGTPAHWNSAGGARQWIELRFDDPIELAEVRLTVAQDPRGRSVHQLLVERRDGRLKAVRTFRGVTADGDVLFWAPPRPVTGVVRLRVLTTRLPGLFPAWREIEALGR